MSLEILRKKIDQIDQEMLTLFESRMQIVKEIGLFKKQHQMSILDQDREKEVLQSRVDQLINQELRPHYTSFVKHLMEISKAYQNDL